MHRFCDFFDSCSYSGDWTDIIYLFKISLKRSNLELKIKEKKKNVKSTMISQLHKFSYTN